MDNIIKLIPKPFHPENNNIIKCLYDIKAEDINVDIQVYNNKNDIEKDINSISIYKEDEMKKK